MKPKCYRCGKEISCPLDLCVCDLDRRDQYLEELSYIYPVCGECKEKAIKLFEEFMEKEEIKEDD